MKDWQLIVLAIGAGAVAAVVFCYLLVTWAFAP
jgi:hypothetical protein